MKKHGHKRKHKHKKRESPRPDNEKTEGISGKGDAEVKESKPSYRLISITIGIIVIIFLVCAITYMKYKQSSIMDLTFPEYVKLSLEIGKETELVEAMVYNGGDALRSLMGVDEDSGKNVVDLVMTQWRIDKLSNITESKDEAHNKAIYHSLLIKNFLCKYFSCRGVTVWPINTSDDFDYIIYYYPKYLATGGKSLLTKSNIEEIFKDVSH